MSGPAENRDVRGNKIQPAEVEAESVSTEQVDIAADVIVSTDDNAGKISNADAGDTIYFESGTHDVAGETFPNKTTVVGPDATLQKTTDGDLVQVGNRSEFFGLTFDGNKSSHTGDGVVDANVNGSGRLVFRNCEFINIAGNGRVVDGNENHRYVACEWSDIDGPAVLFTDTSGNATDCRGIVVDDTCEFKGLSDSAYQMAVKTWDSRFMARHQDPDDSGATYHFEANTIYTNIEFGGRTVEGSGDPIIYVNGGMLTRSTITCHFNHTPGTQTETLSGPVATVHVESSDGACTLTLGGRGVLSASAADSSYVSDQSSNTTELNILGDPAGGGSFDGNIRATFLDTDSNWETAITSVPTRSLLLDPSSEELRALRGANVTLPDGLTVGGQIDINQSNTYSISNRTTDYSYDADNTTVDELADVLGQVINDLGLND
jgi:hypothetical protein